MLSDGTVPGYRLLVSGDGEGKVWFWDFKSGKFFKYVP